MGKRMIYVVLVSVLLAAILMYAWKKEQESSAKEYEEKFLSSRLFGKEVKGPEILELEVNNPNGKFIFKKNENKEWMLTHPVSIEVEPTIMGTMLMSLVETQTLAIVDEGEGITERELEMYRLANPDIKVSFKIRNPEEKTYTLEFGRRSPVESAIYLRRIDTNQIIKAEITFRNNFNGSIINYSNLKIFGFEPDQVKSLDITYDGTHYVFKKEREGEKIWVVKEPLKDIRASINKIGFTITHLSNMHVSRYIEKDENMDYGFEKPFAVITIGSDNAGIESVKIGKSAEPEYPNKRYAYVVNTGRVGLVYIEHLQLLSARLDDLAALKALTFKRRQVNYLSISSKNNFKFTLERNSDRSWRIKDGLQGVPDDVKIDTIIAKIWWVRIRGIVGEKSQINLAEVGLAKPWYTVQLGFSTDKKPITFHLGNPVPGAPEFIYAMNNEDNYVFRITKDFLSYLPNKASDITLN